MVHIAFLGFGEAAMAFLKGWRTESLVTAHAYDIKTGSQGTRSAKLDDYQRSSVGGVLNVAELPAQADVIFSLVTADQAKNAARAVAQFLTSGHYFFDCNSCSPASKRANAALVEAAGARYIDTAVMSPVHPTLHKTPLLLSGVHALEALTLLEGLQMNGRLVDECVGSASAIKMIRSVMIKGMEALSAECLLAARLAGVDDTIIASLDKSFPGFSWRDRAGYNLERMLLHGERRAAEMREVAATISELGLDNGMSKATVQWQQRMGDIEVPVDSDDFGVLADQVLAGLKQTSD